MAMIKFFANLNKNFPQFVIILLGKQTDKQVNHIHIIYHEIVPNKIACIFHNSYYNNLFILLIYRYFFC